MGTKLFEMLIRRSLIGSTYPESKEFSERITKMLEKPVTVYSGFDATSSSLHVGNLATIMNLIHFYRHGHRVICVIGDATTQIGDPSGHTRDRTKLSTDVINSNANSIEETLTRLFNNHDAHFENSCVDRVNRQAPIILRNSRWYKDRNVIEFVSEVFREVRVGGLLHKKSISERLRSPVGMNMSEFCYQIFQAYDWLELMRLYDCKIQIGGADQGGNIYTGHDLIKKLTGEKDAIGLLAPLITTKGGKKLGKSDDGARNSTRLSSTETSPFELYQFFHRTPDKDVERYLKTFSLYDEATIKDLICNNLKRSGDIWYCQRKLAEHVCQLVHGQAGLESAKRITHETYHRKDRTGILGNLDGTAG